MTSVEEANRFFSRDLDIKEYPQYFKDSPRAEDTDGLVSWIGATTEIPSDWSTQYAQTFADLNNLLGIANNYYQSKVQPAQQYDFAMWDLVYSKLPNFGATKAEDKTFSKEVIGVEVAVSFLNLLLDVAVLPVGAAATFGTYLRGIGDSIRLGVETSKESFQTVWNNMTFEFIENVGFVPKLKLYYISFNMDNFEVSTTCGSYKQFNIKLEYKYRAQLFKYEALPAQSTARKEFDDFINKQIKKDIDDADNFFNGSFETDVKARGEEAVAKYKYSEAAIKEYVRLSKEDLRKKYKKEH